MKRKSSLWLSMALCGLCTSATVTVVGQNTQTFVVDRDAWEAAPVAGARVLRTEARRVVVEVPQSAAEALVGDEAKQSVAVPALHFDNGEPAAAMASVARRAAPRPLQIVQFKAPPGKADRGALKAAGLTIVSYVPDNAFLVWAEDDKARAGLASLASDPMVGRTLEFAPALSLSRGLEEFRGSGETVQLEALFYQDSEQFLADFDWLANQPGVRIKEGPTLGFVGSCAFMGLEVPADLIDSLAALPTMVSLTQSGQPKAAGESADLILADRTKIVGGKEVPLTQSEGGSYLAFLALRLLGADFLDPKKYPLVAVVDSGIDNGGSDTDYTFTNPDAPDFRFLGLAGQPSRLQYSYRWDITNNPMATPPFDAGSPTYLGDEGFTVGHGHGIASLVAGFNALAGAANESTTTGHQWGLGTSPYGRIANAKLDGLPFLIPEFLPNYTAADLRGQTAETARLAIVSNPPGGHPGLISNNSFLIIRLTPFSCDSNVAPASSVYALNSMTLDVATRDSLPSADYPEYPGHQRTFFVVAAANSGYTFLGEDNTCTPTTCWPLIPRLNTIPEPGTAKNVLTVGSSEDVDPRQGPASCLTETTSHCMEPIATDPGRADDANDISPFSSKGSLTGFTYGSTAYFPNPRIKPDVVAPGSFAYHLTPAGTVTCGDDRDDIVPGTTYPRIYRRSYGTSLSTPEVSGASQVFALHLKSRYGISDPAPALLKAYAIHTGKFLTGRHSGPHDGTGLNYDPHPLPSPYQGYGRVDMGMGLDLTPRYLRNDETVIFHEPGEKYVVEGFPLDPSKPVRAVLVWTDAVDPANMDLWNNLVNDLDLTVETKSFLNGNKKYWGNLYSRITKQYSLPVTGSTSTTLRDRKNPVEAVFLQNAAGIYNVKVTVGAYGINRDALNPETPGDPQQDFALVIYNFVKTKEGMAP